VHAQGLVVGDEEGEGTDGLLVDEEEGGGGEVELGVSVVEGGRKGGRREGWREGGEGEGPKYLNDEESDGKGVQIQ